MTNYVNKMAEISTEGREKGINPFSISTGTKESINSRFDIFNRIVEESIDDL